MSTKTKGKESAKKTDAIKDLLNSEGITQIAAAAALTDKQVPHENPMEFLSADEEEQYDPIDFLNGLYGSDNKSITKKAAKSTDPAAEKHHKIHHCISSPFMEWKGNLASYDKCKIYKNSALINNGNKATEYHAGHMMIYMSRIDKFFCTHCCATIESRLSSDHLSKCYFTAPIESKYYCPICNSRNTAETALVHFNSAKHMARFSYITELTKINYIYVNNLGSSHSVISNQSNDGDAYAIDIDYMIERAIIARELQAHYALPGGKQLFRLMAQIISHREHGSDEIGANLVQRNAIIKVFDFFKAEVNGRRVLCHPPPAYDKNDFITVSNCMSALKEINYDIIDKQSGDAAQKASKKEKVDKIFSLRSGAAAQCYVCDREHEIQYYQQPAAITKMIDMMKAQLGEKKE